MPASERKRVPGRANIFIPRHPCADISERNVIDDRPRPILLSILLIEIDRIGSDEYREEFRILIL